MQPPFVKQLGAPTRESITGEKDAAGQEKNRLENEMEQALIQYWQGQKQRIQKELEPRIPDDRKQLAVLWQDYKARGGLVRPEAQMDEELKAVVQLSLPFWEDEQALLLSILLPLIQQGAEGGVHLQAAMMEALNINYDWTLAHTQAARWARQYTNRLIKDITETTAQRVQEQVANWIESREHTLPDLWNALMEDPAFDARRAQLIAATESTRAYAEGDRVAAKQMEKEGWFTYEKEWQTARDDRVCVICEPMQSEKVQGVDGVFNTAAGELLGPPAHPACRCWHNMIPKVPK